MVFIPAGNFYRLRFHLDSDVCIFCNLKKYIYIYIETQEHLFYACNIVKLFWDRINEWLVTKNVIPVFKYHIAKFQVVMKDKGVGFLCNNILIMGKFHIHKCFTYTNVTDLSKLHQVLWQLKMNFFQSLKQLKKRSALSL